MCRAPSQPCVSIDWAEAFRAEHPYLRYSSSITGLRSRLKALKPYLQLHHRGNPSTLGLLNTRAKYQRELAATRDFRFVARGLQFTQAHNHDYGSTEDGATENEDADI